MATNYQSLDTTDNVGKGVKRKNNLSVDPSSVKSKVGKLDHVDDESFVQSVMANSSSATEVRISGQSGQSSQSDSGIDKDNTKQILEAYLVTENIF